MSSDPATNTKVERADLSALGTSEASWGQAAPPGSDAAAWITGLLQAGDSFYPTGSYAHSFGLEGLVQEGTIRDRATLRDFLRDQTIDDGGGHVAGTEEGDAWHGKKE